MLKIRGAELRGRFRRRAVMPSRAVGSVAAAAVGRPSIQHVHPHTGPPHAGRGPCCEKPGLRPRESHVARMMRSLFTREWEAARRGSSV